MATTLTYTAGQVCTAALRKINAIASGTDPASEEMDTAILTLNVMLKALQIPSVTVWQLDEGSISITADTKTYTISSRPYELGVVNYKTGGLERSMLPITRAEYFELPDKDPKGQPTQYYYQREREQGVLHVWPVLTSATGTIEWEGKTEIDDITATTDALDVPAEWYEAIIYQLAFRLCDDFEVDTARQQIIALTARQALDLAQHSGRESVYFMPDGGM